ncbi:hypothetical protein [Nocardioides cynanchi]|uniref:hypothetical protein n=1 Tax=Nocardioides cynanchi TaxID=2558918 RepID=UPI0012448C20|nr:hypothetical protein [Nocardioides cynanchi]
MDVAEVRSLELVSEPVATPPTPTRTGAAPRRLSVSTLILLVVVGLEIAAMAVLAFHLAASPQDQGATVSFRSYAAPVPVPMGTAYVRSRVVSPEDLRVTHWVHTGGDVSRLTIRLPHVPGLAPGAVTVSDLLIASDGQQATAPALAGHGPGQTYVVPAGRHIYVSYLLHGALDRSSTVAGRVLARFTALDVATPQQPVDRARYTVLGGRVLAMACSPDRPHALPRPCGGPAGGAWRAVLGRGHTDDRVMAQLDLS